MDASKVRETLDQLRGYTVEVTKFMGIRPVQNGRNSNGPFKKDQPSGAITHYTASNMAVTKGRPFGRLPTMLSRFAPGSSQRVGVHFIVWDQLEKRLNEIRERYPLLKEIPGEVFFMGDTESFWHAGWFNNISYGVEIRNIGRLLKDKKGRFFWNNGVRYHGRTPIAVGNSWWEPYTWQQMAATLWIHRAMSTLYPIRPERFLGHMHVSSTRIDPGVHFPIHEMREYALNRKDVPIKKVPFLAEFSGDPDIGNREDLHLDWPRISEASLHKGLYRHDWDGVPEEFDAESGELKGADHIPEPDSAQERAWFNLRQLGYHVGYGPASKEFIETVKLFQARWKKRNGRLWVQEMRPTGIVDSMTIEKIDRMFRTIYLP